MTNKSFIPSRRRVLGYGAACALSAPFISRTWAAPMEINILAWYGHGEPDVVSEFETACLFQVCTLARH